MKAATQVIVHPAVRHFLECERSHISGSIGTCPVPIPEEEIKNGWTRKLWRRSEPAVVCVKTLSQLFIAKVEPFSARRRAVFGGGAHQIRLDRFSEPSTLLDNLLRLFRPDLSETGQQRTETRTSISIIRWIVGAPQKRLAGGRQKHTHRPTARTGSTLHKEHVDPINVWSFFAVDLNADKVPVQDGGNGRVFE